MDLGAYGVFIVAGVLAVQFFLSTRNRAYWGAILPVAYIVVLTWMLISERMENAIAYVLYLLLGLLFLIAEWQSGRKYLYKKRKNELDKMKTLDLK
ncbi:MULTISPECIES: hypothetical protein [Geobacillus]|jgi:hypothetical protein|uniref:Uncharacterized protein n=2 Tax=Geobacillus thermodenitrificans TaxID=33940 RepID=A4IQU6_GEOTN|nr:MULTISPECIES: hypothetical protein [Geobacillus]ABO67700.1 Conserved hypothetical protein [Geobacillus thermodenitrificans NG80-2]ARA99163.1 hypothetical protein GD3902_14660 [Geobacillus thermodenitrificans]ARP43444.1 hypothetical protein GTHT12_01920 [Geobacillus thermodenitrificans]ATO38476.1 hypothetical protein GTID1_15595 [Geobacillus thermodenitrificans]KQB92580.1 hypothetical protein GEPA3_2407 [Geobacillus sp. PA-3]